MLYVISAVILGVLIVGALFVGIFGPEGRENRYGKVEGGARVPARVVAVLLILILAIITFFASFTRVEARAVGIQTSFGQYASTVQSGAHLLSPWSEVEQFSTLAQPLDLNDKDGSKGEAVSVAFAGADKSSSGGNGVVNAVVRWRIDANSAENLWKKYKSFDTVRDSLVLSEAQDAFREVIGGYTPNAARAGANIRPISDAVKAGLDQRLKDDGIIIDSVSIKGVDLDAATAKSLERTVIANNNEETAKSEQRRAVIDAQTAALREKSGALSPAANQRFCLDIVNQWDVQKNGPLPATFNCALSGGASAGIIVGK